MQSVKSYGYVVSWSACSWRRGMGAMVVDTGREGGMGGVDRDGGGGFGRRSRVACEMAAFK
jgi:hypothetical protein